MFHSKQEMLMLVVHILNDPTANLNDSHLVCLSISQLLPSWFSFTAQILVYLISFSFYWIYFLHFIRCLLACVRLPFSFLFSWPVFWYPPEPFSHPWDALTQSTVKIIYWYGAPCDALKNGYQIFYWRHPRDWALSFVLHLNHVLISEHLAVNQRFCGSVSLSQSKYNTLFSLCYFPFSYKVATGVEQLKSFM